MGYRSDRIVLQTLTAQGAATVLGNWMDLREFVSGAFYAAVNVTAGTLTPSFQMSADGTTAGLLSAALGVIPAAELATPAGISTGVSVVRYPLIGAANLAWVRVSSVIATGPVTGVISFVGRTV